MNFGSERADALGDLLENHRRTLPQVKQGRRSGLEKRSWHVPEDARRGTRDPGAPEGRPLPGAELGPIFGIHGELTDIQPLGRGHIHRTFLAHYRADDGRVERYVHQQLNDSVFVDLDSLMDNFVRISAHLGARAGDDRRAVRLQLTADGRPFARVSGAPWRTLAFIDGSRTSRRFDGPGQAAEGAALAAGLVADLADLTPPPVEVIPAFHDVVERLNALDRARAADVVDRAAECGVEVDVVLSHGAVAVEVAEAREAGVLPQRTVHNDAKVENLLFDATSGQGLCMVDLDTVGPGTVLFDVGDLVRSGAVTGPEDADAAALSVDPGIVTALLDGYARAGAGFLTPAEVRYLPVAGPLMALESAARFLTDHLQGDVYFRVDGPGHNLRRARNQIRILELLRPG